MSKEPKISIEEQAKDLPAGTQVAVDAKSHSKAAGLAGKVVRVEKNEKNGVLVDFGGAGRVRVAYRLLTKVIDGGSPRVSETLVASSVAKTVKADPKGTTTTRTSASTAQATSPAKAAAKQAYHSHDGVKGSHPAHVVHKGAK